MTVTDHRLETKERVVLQYLENTGRHLLDSGDFYGRGWERSRAAVRELLGDVDVDDIKPGSESMAKVVQAYDQQSQGDMDWADLSATINLYHWMTEQLEYVPYMNQWFDQFVQQQDEKQDLGAWSNYHDAFLRQLDGLCYDPETRELVDADDRKESDERIVLQPVLGGCRGDEIWAEYTYNHDNWLSRDIIISAVDFGDAIYCGVQLHNGCDAR